jgi:hypothetical protein
MNSQFYTVYIFCKKFAKTFTEIGNLHFRGKVPFSEKFTRKCCNIFANIFCGNGNFRECLRKQNIFAKRK